MPEYDLWAEKVCSVYLARPVIRLGPPLEPDHSAHFVPAETAPDLIDNTGDRHFLMRALGFHCIIFKHDSRNVIIQRIALG